MEDRLRKFARIVETGSFTEAAAALHISQPALSTATFKLERELGAPLFARRQPPLKLTPVGEATYRYTKSLEAQTNNFRLALAELTRQKPRLSVGMIDSIAQTLFSEGNFLTQAQKQAHISLLVNNSDSLIKALQQGQLDMAILTEQTAPIPQTIRQRPLGNEPLLGLTNTSNAWEVSQALGQGTLSNFMSYIKHSNTDRLIRAQLRSQNIEPKTIFRSTSPEVLLQLTLAGEGSAVLPYLLVRDALSKGLLAPITPTINRPIVALEHTATTTPLVLVSLCKAISNRLGTLTTESNALV